MKQLSGLLPVVLAIALCWVVSGGSCLREAAPQLVRVADVTPREVELGDRVAIVGEGFPPGREARVTFRGTLHRPGERPEPSAEIVLSGVVAGPEQVEIAFGEATQALFCRAGDRAAHTTFDGDLEVAFASASPGASPVAGVLRHVVFDVRPSAAPSDVDREREGQRLLSWVGLQVSTGSSGVLITRVDPASRAAAAGLSAGERIESFDDVRVASVADLLPSPGARQTSVVVRRPEGGAGVVRTLAVDGFRRAPPGDLVGAALVVLGALLVALLVGGPTRPALAIPLQRMVTRLRGGARSALASAVREVLPPRGPVALVDAVVFGLLAAMPFGQYLVAAQMDVGLLFVAAMAAATVAALLGSGASWRGPRAALHVALQHVPAAVAVVAMVATTGSLRMQEIARTQGGWPWDWLAFRSPGALLAFLLLLGSARIEPDAPDAPAGIAAFLEDSPPARPRGTWLVVACRAHLLLVAGLVSTLFLGGWLLPGLTAAEQTAHPALQLAGAAWLLGKTWGVALVVLASRAALPAMRLAERTRAVVLVWAPASLAALAAAAAWTWWSPSPPAQSLASGALVCLVALVAASLLVRLRHGLVSPAGDGRVSPFL